MSPVPGKKLHSLRWEGLVSKRADKETDRYNVGRWEVKSRKVRRQVRG